MSVRDTFGWRPFRAVRGHASAALAPPPAASVQRSCHARSLNEHGCRRVLSGGTVRDAPVIEGVQPGHAQRDDSRHWSHVDRVHFPNGRTRPEDPHCVCQSIRWKGPERVFFFLFMYANGPEPAGLAATYLEL